MTTKTKKKKPEHARQLNGEREYFSQWYAICFPSRCKSPLQQRIAKCIKQNIWNLSQVKVSAKFKQLTAVLTRTTFYTKTTSKITHTHSLAIVQSHTNIYIRRQCCAHMESGMWLHLLATTCLTKITDYCGRHTQRQTAKWRCATKVWENANPCEYGTELRSRE